MNEAYLKSNDIRKIERNPHVLLNTCKVIGLAVNTEETEYMEVGCKRGMMAHERIRKGRIRMK